MIRADEMTFYCNNCGVLCNRRPDQAIGKNWRCCSIKCYRVIELKDISANIRQPLNPKVVEEILKGDE